MKNDTIPALKNLTLCLNIIVFTLLTMTLLLIQKAASGYLSAETYSLMEN